MNIWWWQTIESITVMFIALAAIAGAVYLWSHEFYWGAFFILVLTSCSNAKVYKYMLPEKEEPKKETE